MKPPTSPPVGGVLAEPFHLLELNIISAQDLQPVSRSMSTYAVAWIQPQRRLCTRVDSGNHVDPQWNDKFVFRVDEWFLRNETSAVMVEIYCVGWLRDTLVGSVRMLIGNLLPKKGGGGLGSGFGGMRFTALQVRRPSGRPQGILNLGVTVLDATLRSMPLYAQLNPAIGYRELMGKNFGRVRRSKSVSVLSEAEKVIAMEGSEVTMAEKASSVDGASIVGAGEEFFLAEVEDSVLEDWNVASSAGKEEVGEKLEKWRSEFPPVLEHSSGGLEWSSFRHQVTDRRTTSRGAQESMGGNGWNGTGGLRSCFGEKITAACECSVSCGTSTRKKASGGVEQRTS
ncbi:uncharacterized protein LOC116252639 [Nymphaea colorata]|uniref:C2 domain-containing protein n=1 Tax=Nymphaea colorata TaxID=210225 RepID=A0A5K1CY23_9MAGN|nr:uncharacterized protein LOC116252639 [Nymphaea colorata]